MADSKAARVYILAGAALVVLAAAAALLPPIQQPQDYHRFADQRAFLGVPNAWNVLSNVPFLVVGALGLLALRRLPVTACATAAERRALTVVFLALAAVGLGSTYYHLAPSDARLFWDRLPLAVLLMALAGVVALERVGGATGERLFWPVVALGVVSAIAWRITGDLRPYVVVQAGAIIAVPVLLIARRPRYTRGGDLAALVFLYGLAKATEAFDARIMIATTGLISGHALKHVLSAAGMAIFLRHVKRRTLVNPGRR